MCSRCSSYIRGRRAQREQSTFPKPRSNPGAQARPAAHRPADRPSSIEAYKDELRGRIEAAIQKKVEGQEISVADTAPAGEGKVIDLMEALRASLEKSESARAQVNRLGPRKGPKRAEEPAKVARKANKRNA